MPDEISGINMLVLQAGTAITDQTDATLTSTPEVAESITKNTNFPNRLPGDQDWMISLDTQIPRSSGEDALVNGNAGLEVEVDTTDDATDNPTLQQVPGVQSLTLTLDQELQSVPPGIADTTGWNYYVALRQSWEIEVEGHYYDPSNSADGVYDKIHEAREQGEPVPGTVTVLGVTMEGDLVADDFELASGTDDPASQSLPFMGTGEIVQTSSFETSLEELLALYFGQNTATVALQHTKNGSVVTGSTLWQGDAFLSSAEITLERNSFPELSAELQGTGSLDRITQ